ncbi:MAG TPA: HEAT repeat domain-containing protein [Thermoanaerobaculia bacterium]|nr:HEAT repeat domain-containing protein [Thermoanaerobaculia bacterium]
MREQLPLLLTESLDAAQRERTHQHIEDCAACTDEWNAYREAWRMMEDLPEVPVPPRVKARFLEAAGIAEAPAKSNVVPFRKRPAFKWIAQAAAVVLLAGGGYFAGRETTPKFQPSRAEITNVQSAIKPLSIAETRVVDADAISPEIEGRPNISNVQFIDFDASDNQIGLSFDITSRWTVSGNPKEKSMVRLLSYMLENESAISPRSNTLDLVRQAYANPANADPEITGALAKVLRNDEHEGVRIRAVDTLNALPSSSGEPTRDALIDALKSDPNPAVRLKAVEALANLAASGKKLDAEAVDTLRQKAMQNDENPYLRMKAAEILKNVKP